VKFAVLLRLCALVACVLASMPGANAAPIGEHYFIDFRARPSTFIGHTFILYGRVDAQGRVVEHHIAGLVPEHEVWRGLIIPIEANVREYEDDRKRLPTVIYRRTLTAAEYGRVHGTVRRMRAVAHQWHVLFFNCNDFAIVIAEALGMVRPPSLLPPSVWVAHLRALNGR
jgi:hypothetical protein